MEIVRDYEKRIERKKDSDWRYVGKDACLRGGAWRAKGTWIFERAIVHSVI